MKLAITTTGIDLDSKINARFGRGKHFLVVDSETMATTVIDNAQNLNLPQGAGIQAAQTLVDAEVDALLTDNCGPKAFTVLQAAGVKVYQGVSGNVRDAVKLFQDGRLVEATSANVEGHW
jgi:predicted Fe-Mo cluster-binding NifX family protein